MTLRLVLPSVAGKKSFPRIFRIDAQYRRSCLYLLVGGWICLGVAIYVRGVVGKPLDLAHLGQGVVLLVLAPSALWIYAITYRLRVDEWGLSRRRLGWWTLWPWESFLAGDVTIDKLVFIRRLRPLWDRWLVAAFLPADEARFLKELVESRVPDECKMEGRRLKLAETEISEATLGLVPLYRLKINRAELEWRDRRIAWQEVAEFRLEATVHGRFDVFRLTMTLASGPGIRGTLNEVILPRVSLRPQTAGHDEWVRHIQSLVPPRCWKHLRVKGPLRSLEEGEFRLAHWKNWLRAWFWIEVFGWSCSPLCAAIFVPKIVALWNVPFMALGWKIVASTCMVLIIIQLTVTMVALAWNQRRLYKQRLAETRAQIEALPKPARDLNADQCELNASKVA